MGGKLKDWKVLGILILGPLISLYFFGAWQPAVIVLIATVLGFLVYWEIPAPVAVAVALIVAFTLLNQMGWFDPQSALSKIGEVFGSVFDQLGKSS